MVETEDQSGSGAKDDGTAEPDGSGSAAAAVVRKPLIEQVEPPFDVKTPPQDAVTTRSGLVYKKLVTNDGGPQAKPGDTAMVTYTGWRQRTGETFFTSTKRGLPIGIDIAHAAPGFAEALRLLRKGEKAVLWLSQSPGTAEPLVYAIEIVDFVAPQVPVRSKTKPRSPAEAPKRKTV